MRFRNIGRAILTATLASACATCGTEPPTQSLPAAEVVLRSVPKTVAAKTSRFSYVLSVSPTAESTTASPDNASEVTYVESRGVFDFQLMFGSSELTHRQLGLGGPTKAIFDRALIYQKPPAELRVQYPIGKEWLKFDLARLDESTGVDAARAFWGDPSTALAFLLTRALNVEFLGSETIRGVSAQRYQMTLDSENWRWHAAHLSAEHLSILRIKTRPFRSGTYRAEVWIDGVGRVRRLVLVGKMRPPTGPESVELGARQTYEYFDFGVPVRIALPPRGQVLTIAKFGSADPLSPPRREG